jgi:coiled-coil and C2 domain-containing protein 1
MLEHTKKDLDALRFTFKRGDAVPKFHYEVRAFSRVVCNAELTDNDLEFSIIQGINYAGANPKDMQTYCR